MKINRLVVIVWCAMLVVATAVTTADAMEGFFVSIQMPFNKIKGDFDNKKMASIDSGAGLGFIGGFGLTPAFSVELDWGGSGHKSNGIDVGFGELSLNGKYAFFASANVQPFLFAGVGSFALKDDNRTLSGGGTNLGFGLDIYATSNLSFGVAVIKKLIVYRRVVKGDDIIAQTGHLNGNTNSLRFDVTYHF